MDVFGFEKCWDSYSGNGGWSTLVNRFFHLPKMDDHLIESSEPRMEIVLWAHSDEGKNKEAMLHSPMRGFEVLVDDAFDFQAVDVE